MGKLQEQLEKYMPLAKELGNQRLPPGFRTRQNDIVFLAVMGLVDKVEGLKEISDYKNESEQLQVQLAGCSTAALGSTKDVAKPGDYGWSQSYQDVLNLRIKYEQLLADYDDAVNSKPNPADFKDAEGNFDRAGYMKALNETRKAGNK
jgi:hypothetical protein